MPRHEAAAMMTTNLDPRRIVADGRQLSAAIISSSSRLVSLPVHEFKWHLATALLLDACPPSHSAMYLPPLIARLLPLFSESTSPSASTSATATVKTFRPIKAHANQPNTPALLWHNASEAHSLQDMRAFDLDAREAIHSLDNGDSIDPPPLVLRTRRIPIMRPRLGSSTGHLRNWTSSQRSSLLSATLEWEETEVEAPDTTDRETLRTLAMMSSNAYIEPNSTDWYPLDKWNVVSIRLPSCSEEWTQLIPEWLVNAFWLGKGRRRVKRSHRKSLHLRQSDIALSDIMVLVI